MADTDIKIKVTADSKGVNQSLQNTQREVDATNKKVKKLNVSFDQVKMAAVAGFAAIAGTFPSRLAI